MQTLFTDSPHLHFVVYIDKMVVLLTYFLTTLLEVFGSNEILDQMISIKSPSPVRTAIEEWCENRDSLNDQL